MEHSRPRRSRRKALRDCVGSVRSFFFSSWPHKDRVVLRSLYDRQRLAFIKKENLSLTKK
ncbi:uncharacterized protein LOC142775715 isoform X2 [Rhipicephalus microplus]|uniref:uncharacterized protein LOC142775715 isoform X2 n=1 Tax=Rhipicephalus microplus TaxID=6941 RepID=UPI003F6D59AE